MKRLNNKGITTIEVIISFVITVIITTSLYTTVSNYNQKRLIENYRSKIYTYKNTLTKEIQDDFIKIGLTHASYEKKHVGPSIIHTVNCDLRDGTKRKLIVTQTFTESTYHKGSTTDDDFFLIQYGNEEAGDLLDYPLPNVGESITEHGKIAYDLSINNVLINIEDDNVLSIYIGFYHPELMTRYGINIICPIDFVSKGVDTDKKFNVPEAVRATRRYNFRSNGGSGIINPVAATIGQPFVMPGKGLYKREGYTLKSWNTQPDGSGTTYDLEETVVPTANQSSSVVLYAQWAPVSAASFTYSGSGSTYNAPEDGIYKLEVWGAQGGSYDTTYYGGYGAYATGEIRLTKGDALYIHVGGKGTAAPKPISGTFSNTGGYNGGGAAYATSDCGNFAASGGGATHIATAAGQLTSLSSNKGAIYIVAAGGGGASYRKCSDTDWHYSSGGNGGGIEGTPPLVFNNSGWTLTHAGGGTQTAGGTKGLQNNEQGSTAGTFGKGGSWNSANRSQNYVSAIGGGGGFYGGGGGMFIGGAGGSSYIGNEHLQNKFVYCYKCTISGDTATKTYSTESISSDPKPNKVKTGNGAAKITYISD